MAPVRDIHVRCAIALTLLTVSAATTSAQPTPDGRPVQRQPNPERCCLADDWADRCASLLPRIHDEAYGPYDLGAVTVEARVRCRTETVLSAAAQTHVREMLSLEFVDPPGRVLYRREFRGERGYPIFRHARIAIIRGDRVSGVLLQETRSPDGDILMSVSTLTLLVHRDGRIATLGPPLRIVDGVMAPFAETTAAGLALRGDQVEVVVEASRVDAYCTIAIDWKRGFRLPRRMTCDAGAHEPEVAPEDGSVLLYDAPRSKAAPHMTRVDAGVQVRVLRARGRLVPVYASPYRNFAEEWIEVQIGSRRGWIRRPQDVELLGIFVERC